MLQDQSNLMPEQGAHVPYVRAVRAHPFLVVIIGLVAVIVAQVWRDTRSPKYEATAQVLVSPVAYGGAYVGLPVITESANDPSRTLQTATSVLKSQDAALATAGALGHPWTEGGVAAAVTVQPLGESDIVSVTGTASRPQTAATLANVYTREGLAQHVTQLVDGAKAQIGQLQAHASGLPAGSAEAAQIDTQLAALSSVAGGHDPNFSFLQHATPPAAATETSRGLIAVLSLLAGLVIGVAAAATLEYLDRRVHEEDDALAIYPLPVLARIPVLPRGASDANAFQLVPPPVREAFRTLQVQVPPMPSSGARTVMFTSASPRDGKTGSTIDFALVLAAAGYRVILLDLDLRKPEVADRLGGGSVPPESLRSDATLEDLLVEVPSAPGLRMLGLQHGGDVRLLELISRRLPLLLDEARADADYVILDTPPLGQVSDALRVATAVDDTIVLVVRSDNTDSEALRRTRELLDRMAVPPTGMLFIGDSTRTDVYGGYGVYGGDVYGDAVERAVSGTPTVTRAEHAPAPPAPTKLRRGGRRSTARRS
jgi:Mrp family chromosome partitioning ATPase/capsular polysaccharide biosynthesis protein